MPPADQMQQRPLAFTNQQYNYSAAVSFALGAVVFVASYLFLFVTDRRRRAR
jgi:multiple sugar transport system permease protein